MPVNVPAPLPVQVTVMMIHQTRQSKGADASVILRPSIPVAVFLMAGIVAGLWRPGGFYAASVAAGLVGLWMVRTVCVGRQALWAPLIFCFVCGYLSIQPWLRSDWPADHVSHFVEQGKWQVTGLVVDRPRIDPRHVKIALAAEQLHQAARSEAVQGRIWVTVRRPAPEVQPGDRIVFSGHLHAIHAFCNPDGFDYERFMALKGIHTRLYALGNSVRIESSGQAFRLDGFVRERRWLAGQMDQLLGGHRMEAVQLLKALTLGDRDALSQELREAFSRAGVSHVLAISGLHVGMVAASAFALFAWALAWVPALRTRAWVRRCAAILSLVPVVGYAMLAGFSPSTERAVIMVTVFLMTFWVGRPHDWLNALAVAAVVILVVSPPQLTFVSFQLSFAAVFAIILGMGIIGRFQPVKSAPWWRRWGYRPLVLLVVSVLAILGTAPLVARYFNQVAWLGPLTNLAVVPVVGMVSLPAGLLGIVLSPISTGAAEICWHAAAYGLEVVVWLVTMVARWPLAAGSIVTPTILEMALFYLLVTALFQWRRPWQRNISLAVVLVAGSLDAAYWYQRRFAPEMAVTAVDVGQGSAYLIQLPRGFTILFDGGGFGDNAAFDIGRSVVAPLLWRNKIKTVDLVILSHPNSDHLNGLLFILRKFKVGQVWSNGEAVETMGFRQWQQLIETRRIDHPPFALLPRHTEINDVRIDILGPPVDFDHHGKTDPWRDPNNNSLVVRFVWDKISFLFCGDIEKPAERYLLSRYGAATLQSTILTVPHHGSRSSSTQAFLDAVRPRVAIVSAGWRNRFRFPHQAVLKKLNQADCQVLRTDQCGAVRVGTNGRTFRVATCRQGCR